MFQLEVFDVARQGLKLETVKKKQSTNNRNDCPMNEKNVNNQAENIVIHEPDIVKTKGRPGRYKAFWEKKNSIIARSSIIVLISL